MSAQTKKNSRAAIAASRDYKRYAEDLYAVYVEETEQRSTLDLVAQALARGLRAGAPASRPYVPIISKVLRAVKPGSVATGSKRGLTIVLPRGGGDDPRARPSKAPDPRSGTPSTEAVKPADRHVPAPEDVAELLGEMVPDERTRCSD
jgi:hypothetical protein